MLRAALEAGVVAGAACAALRASGLDPAARAAACRALGLAWAVCTTSAAALAYGRRGSSRRFWGAFGFGVFLRVAALGGLMLAAWGKPPAEAAAPLGAYVLGAAAMTLIEFRHLTLKG